MGKEFLFELAFALAGSLIVLFIIVYTVRQLVQQGWKALNARLMQDESQLSQAALDEMKKTYELSIKELNAKIMRMHDEIGKQRDVAEGLRACLDGAQAENISIKQENRMLLGELDEVRKEPKKLLSELEFAQKDAKEWSALVTELRASLVVAGDENINNSYEIQALNNAREFLAGKWWHDAGFIKSFCEQFICVFEDIEVKKATSKSALYLSAPELAVFKDMQQLLKTNDYESNYNDASEYYSTVRTDGSGVWSTDEHSHEQSGVLSHDDKKTDGGNTGAPSGIDGYGTYD